VIWLRPIRATALSTVSTPRSWPTLRRTDLAPRPSRSRLVWDSADHLEKRDGSLWITYNLYCHLRRRSSPARISNVWVRG
jgi:hypothetical protein